MWLIWMVKLMCYNITYIDTLWLLSAFASSIFAQLLFFLLQVAEIGLLKNIYLPKVLVYNYISIMPLRYITLKQSDSFKKYLEQPNWNYQPNLNITNNTIEQQQTQSVRENMYCGRTTNVPEDIPFVVAESFVQTDHSIGDLTDQRESNSLPEKSVTKTPAKRKKEKPYGVTHAKKQKNEGTILIRWFIYTSSFMTSFIY